MASTIWRGYITFGLVSIPVRLFRAARAERVSFRRLYRSGPAVKAAPVQEQEDQEVEEEAPPQKGNSRMAPQSQSLFLAHSSTAKTPVEPQLTPVQQASVRKGTEDVVPQGAIVKGYEYEKDRYVVVDAEELKSIAPKTATEMEIGEFVQLSEIDPVYFETSYYVVPEQAGEKAYALLYRSLQTAGLVALAKFAMHNREHVVVIRSGKKGLIAHTMFFSTEVRGDEEFQADVSNVNKKELDLAQTLIHSLAGPFEPEKYRDTYREKLEEILAKKVEGKPLPVTRTPAASSTVVDITEALQKSLAALKKPAAKEPPTTKSTSKTSAGSSKKASRGAGEG
jgi:DNA end-binding protein Ku